MRTALAVALGVFISFCLIYYARPISEWLVDKFSRGPRLEAEAPIAEVVVSTGQSFVRTRSNPKFIPADNGMGLFRKDEIKTERSARLHLKMPSGYEIELLPESQMTLDLWSPKSGPEYFSLTRGNFRVLKTGEKGKLFVLQNSKAYLPEEAQGRNSKPLPIFVQSPTSPENIQALPSPTSAPLAPTTTNRIGARMPEKRELSNWGTLTSAYIETVLANQAPQFRRCQLSSLRDGTASVGNLNLSFTIALDGTTQYVRVLGSNLKNKELESCAVSVIERTKFKSYSGTAVQLSYPIEFR